MRQGYKSNAQLYEAMQQLHVQYPTLTRVFSIGQSANGTAIMALELSAQAGVDEQHEPHVKLVANMHGNEPSGRELLLRFAVMLLSRHGADPLVTALLEHTHVFIVPTLNPDGFTLGRRGNVNRIDLNRNFPDQFTDPKEDLARRQPETRALMEFTRQYPFVLSANMHEGDLVVNYPFDGNAEGRSRYSKVRHGAGLTSLTAHRPPTTSCSS
jgi:carboxypeptidase D